MQHYIAIFDITSLLTFSFHSYSLLTLQIYEILLIYCIHIIASRTNIQTLTDHKRLHDVDHYQVNDDLQPLVHKVMTSLDQTIILVSKRITGVPKRLHNMVHGHIVAQ